jgi:hypothetical protein
MTIYNNIPPQDRPTGSNSDATTKTFNSFYQVPLEIDTTVLTSIKSYFETRGYGSDASESIAIIILSQATKDKLDPFGILDTLRAFSGTQISSLVAEILNYNRFKTSTLGVTVLPTPADEIQRNILI